MKEIKLQQYLSLIYEENNRTLGAQYGFIIEDYIRKGIFTLRKNDEVLLKYLKDKDIHIDNIKEIIKELLIYHDTTRMRINICVILDFLKWSYGIKPKYNIDPSMFRKRKCRFDEKKEYKSTSSVRKQLLIIRKKCEICGLAHEKLLKTSHIKPKNKCKQKEIYDINNVLLLCSLHDGAFDQGLITFDDNGNSIISNYLGENDINLMGLTKGININLNV